MTLEISVDYEEQMITLIVDGSATISAYKEADNSIRYSRLKNIESEETQEKLKQVCETLFSIEEI